VFWTTNSESGETFGGFEVMTFGMSLSVVSLIGRGTNVSEKPGISAVVFHIYLQSNDVDRRQLP
jgi:hypothetical protein